MEEKRRTIFLVLFSIYSSTNIFLVCKIQGSREVRDSWQEVYMRRLCWWDILLFAVLNAVTYILLKCFIEKAVPKLRALSAKYLVTNNGNTKGFFRKTYACIFVMWFVFFLAFYPGTAMNDTIRIIEDPLKLSNQHPILYNMYLYAFYRAGCFLHNPNLGLAFLSLVQMAGMAFVLAKAVTMLRQRGAVRWLCCTLTVYFGIAPLFPTYAVSAIKDTPFSFCLFALLLLLFKLASGNGTLLDSKSDLLQMSLWLFGIISFRNNGIMIVLGLALTLCLFYKKHIKQILILFGGVVVLWLLVRSLITPAGNEPLFQERVGIPLQQTAAVVVKGKPLEEDEAQYLYRLLPEEEWQNYSPGCSDTLKWSEQFDREYLNQTKGQFIRIWGKLLLKNPRVCAEAYLLSTYGIWGIETRNKEQYYNKEIWENTLGLYQNSPLPELLRKLIVVYYCNRFTYRYLSMGTAYWLLFAVTLWLLYRKLYQYVVITVPLWLLFVSLLVATPIAFAFRYGFVIAMAFPFYVLLPFMDSREGSYLDG
ncbi:MAG: hypothetical protein K2N44_08075 [Lachnospiraceae bacterium]|nr:hypothetical protein [Lachnospiraceae bacterium]